MQDTVGEARTNQKVAFSYWILHMDVPVFDDPVRVTYSSVMKLKKSVYYFIENLLNF